MSKSTKDKKADKKAKADSKDKKDKKSRKEAKAKAADAKTTKKAATKKTTEKETKAKKTTKTTKIADKDTKAKKETKPTKKDTKKEDKKPAAKTAPKPAAKEKKVEKETKPAAEKKTTKDVKPKKTPAKGTKPKVAEKEVAEEVTPTFEGILLFGKWDFKGLEVVDPGLKTYINLRPVIVPHTGGRYAHQRFKKADMPIVERLVNKLMRKQRGTGKKARQVKAVKIAFEIIHLQTQKNPIQVLIDAIQNAAPREEVTRITYGGMAQLQSVDVAPMRRVDIALTNIIEGVYKKSFNNILTAEEILARELMDAADNKPSSFAVSKMLEIERVALSAR
ncbi:MAG: 30S ribosomal protein S7 [Candidatus Heimdallarchaeota archaeon]